MEIGMTKVQNGWILEVVTVQNQKRIYVEDSLSDCCDRVLKAEAEQIAYIERIKAEAQKEAEEREAAEKQAIEEAAQRALEANGEPQNEVC
jgi:23S rRNA pseudoU1915 N3-methylase RlmH